MSVPVPLRRAFRSRALLELLVRADEQGWEWRVGGRHIVVYPPDATRTPLTLSTTAYDGAANQISVAQFKRAGLR
jgi:hypothetical protein